MRNPLASVVALLVAGLGITLVGTVALRASPAHAVSSTVLAFGAATPLGAPPAAAAPTVALAGRPQGDGYWLVAADGGVFSYGEAAFHGSAAGLRLNAPVVDAAATPSGNGYWLVAADGGVFSYGDARFHGSATGLARGVVAIVPTPTGGGYWLVAADGGVFSYGDARFHGSAVDLPRLAPVSDAVATPDGQGYWLVDQRGAVYAFGSAPFVGSIADVRPAHPVTAVARTPSGRGLWLATADGTVSALGDALDHGSGPAPAGSAVADLAALADGSGYWVAVAEQPSTPPPPATGATGRRVVYANRAQRVWLIEADGTVTRTFPVSGRAGVPAPGTYTVFSQSRFTTGARDSRITMEYMTRFTRSARGANIGFHSIPLNRGVPMQSEAQLGTFQSAGCVRMASADAAFLYAWAPVGTTVVVTP